MDGQVDGKVDVGGCRWMDRWMDWQMEVEGGTYVPRVLGNKERGGNSYQILERP